VLVALGGFTMSWVGQRSSGQNGAGMISVLIGQMVTLHEHRPIQYVRRRAAPDFEISVRE
jgi:hypothetical protein